MYQQNTPDRTQTRPDPPVVANNQFAQKIAGEIANFEVWEQNAIVKAIYDLVVGRRQEMIKEQEERLRFLTDSYRDLNGTEMRKGAETDPRDQYKVQM